MQKPFRHRRVLILGLGSESTSHPSPAINSISTLLGGGGIWYPAGGTEEQQTRPEKALSGPLEHQALQDKPPISLAEVLQVSFPLPVNKEIQPLTPHITKPKAWLWSQ